MSLPTIRYINSTQLSKPQTYFFSPSLSQCLPLIHSTLLHSQNSWFLNLLPLPLPISLSWIDALVVHRFSPSHFSYYHQRSIFGYKSCPWLPDPHTTLDPSVPRIWLKESSRIQIFKLLIHTSFFMLNSDSLSLQ